VTFVLVGIALLSFPFAAGLFIADWSKQRRAGNASRPDWHDPATLEHEVYQRLYGDLRRRRLVVEQRMRDNPLKPIGGPSPGGERSSKEVRRRAARPRFRQPSTSIDGAPRQIGVPNGNASNINTTMKGESE